MANKLYDEASVRAIADKIREKANTSATYKIAEMPDGIDAVYAAGQAAGGSGGGGIVPTGEINITENGTYDVTNYASALVAVASSGSSDVVTGTFEIVNPNNADTVYQVSTTDFIVEADIGVHDISSLMAVFDDPDKNVYKNARELFFGTAISNGNVALTAASNTGENVSFLDPSAQHTRYDKDTGVLYIHVGQWVTIKCGTYRFFAW